MSILILFLPALLIIFIILAVREDNNYMENKHNAKYAFYYLLSLVALIFSALSIGMIIFSIIDKTIPDALNNYSGSVDSQLKFAISALFIAVPIFYFVSSLINKGLRRGELNKESGIRRWLTYFILLVSSLIILGVFINVINNFLSGELTARFILKALVVFILSVIIFTFYFYDIKRANPENPDKVVKIFFYATLVLALAAFIAAWFFVESPATARARRLDQALIQNMYSLESAVNYYYERNNKLPENWDELRADKSTYLAAAIFSDPDTKAAIDYKKLSDTEFELCATFRTDSLANQNNSVAYAGPGPIMSSKDHAAGYQCLRGDFYNVGVKSITTPAVTTPTVVKPVD